MAVEKATARVDTPSQPTSMPCNCCPVRFGSAWPGRLEQPCSYLHSNRNFCIIRKVGALNIRGPETGLAPVTAMQPRHSRVRCRLSVPKLRCRPHSQNECQQVRQSFSRTACPPHPAVLWLLILSRSMAMLSPAGFSLISLRFSLNNFHISLDMGARLAVLCCTSIELRAAFAAALQTDIAF